MTADRQPLTDLDGPSAAPDHHQVVFENDHVRVLSIVIRSGDTAPLHTHLVPHLLIATSGGHFVRRDEAGAVLVDTRDRGSDFRIPAYAWHDGIGPHTLENIGPADILATAIEFKD